MTNTDGKLVKLESGGWAQYRHLTVPGLPSTLLVAVELTEEEVRKMVPSEPAEPAEPANPPTLH